MTEDHVNDERRAITANNDESRENTRNLMKHDEY